MTENLRNYLWELIYKKLENIVIKINSLSNNMSERGEDNEKYLIELLEYFLPNKYKLENRKKILNKLGKQSSEHDIIIWNPNSHPPIFSQLLDDLRFFLIEMVNMCIEVKTTLNKKELREALLKIRDFRRKMLDGIHATYFYGPKTGYHEPLYFIFAYDTEWKKFSTILKNIKEIIIKECIQPHERFDYLFILRKGIIIQWTIPEELIKRKKKNKEEETEEEEKKNMTSFLRKNIYCVPTIQMNILYKTKNESLSPSIIMPYDLTRYFGKNYFKQNIQFFPSMLINESYALDKSSDYPIRLNIEQVLSREYIAKNLPQIDKELIENISLKGNPVFTIINLNPLRNNKIPNLNIKIQIIALRKFISTLCKALQDRQVIPADIIIDDSYYELIKVRQSETGDPF